MSNRPEQPPLPRLSLGLPVFNGEKHLETVLKCLLDQTFEDFEIIIADNASVDRTPQICRDYAAKDSRIRYVRNPSNVGAAPNFNKTFHLSRGMFFKWVAHDDYYPSNYLDRCMDQFVASEIVLAHTGVIAVDGEGKPLRQDEITNMVVDPMDNRLPPLDPLHPAESSVPTQRFDDVLHRIHWSCQVFGVMRTDVLRKTGLQRSYYGADKVLLAELALLGRFAQVEEILFHKRVHAGMTMNLSTSEKRKWIDTNVRFQIPQLLMLKDYLSIVISSALPVIQKWRCLISIFRLFSRQGVWHKVFVPGPYNYFGINFRQSRTRSAD